MDEKTRDLLIGARIKEAREKKGITRKEMAERLEISVKGYEKYEQGKSFPRLKHFMALLNALNVSADYILFGEGGVK